MSIFLLKEIRSRTYSILVSLALFLNSNKLSISFSFFERQLFQRSGPLADTANHVVFGNIYGTEKFIQGKLVGQAWHCFCGMVDLPKAFSPISNQDHCERSSPSQISNMPRVGFEPEQNLSSGLVE